MESRVRPSPCTSTTSSPSFAGPAAGAGAGAAAGAAEGAAKSPRSGVTSGVAVEQSPTATIRIRRRPDNLFSPEWVVEHRLRLCRPYGPRAAGVSAARRGDRADPHSQSGSRLA